jgi:NSS family neurotransmitter:Na+ symporter
MSIRHDPIKSRLSRSSTLFLMLLGAAVGFGNIWKFPILVGQYGGLAFILVYVVFLLLLGIPIMMAELGLGREAARNPVDTIGVFCRNSNVNYGWKTVGWFAVIASLVVLSFYSVIGGMGMAYILYSAFGVFHGSSALEVRDTIAGLQQNPGLLIVWHSLFLIIVAVIVSRGVRDGVARAARTLVPIMVILGVVMLVRASTMDSFAGSYQYLFHFAPGELSWRGVLEALSHSFFTLTIGLGAVIAYGSYMPERMSIPWTALAVALADMLIALMAGLVILSLALEYDQSPQQGFGLVFQTIPWLFGKESMGQFWGATFFLMLTFAAWTSAIALAEPFVVWLVERTGLSRKKACIVLTAIAWMLGCVVVFSLNDWKEVRFAGLTPFGLLDFFTSRFLIPVGGLLFTLFIGIRVKRLELSTAIGFKRHWMFSLWYANLRYFMPLAILVVFLFGIFKFTETACHAESSEKSFLCSTLASAQVPVEKVAIPAASEVPDKNTEAGSGSTD